MSEWHLVAAEPGVPKSGFYTLGIADAAGEIQPLGEFFLGPGYPIHALPAFSRVTHWRGR